MTFAERVFSLADIADGHLGLIQKMAEFHGVLLIEDIEFHNAPYVVFA